MKFTKNKIIVTDKEAEKILASIYSCKTPDQLVTCWEWLQRLKLFDQFKKSFRKKLEKHGYRKGGIVKVDHQQERYQQLIKAIES